MKEAKIKSGSISKFVHAKTVSKDILKKSPQATYDLSATEVPAVYVNRFFKSSYIAEGRNKNE